MIFRLCLEIQVIRRATIPHYNHMFKLKQILLLKILIFGENSPFTPLLGELLLEEDVEDEGIGHESSKEEEDASCIVNKYLLEV